MATRRGVLRSFLLGLFGSFVKPWGVLGQSLAQSSPERDAMLLHRFEGLQILRFLNTALRWHWHETGHYCDYEDLLMSPAIGRLQVSPLAEKAGIGAAFIQGIDLSSVDIRAGWRVHFTLLDGGKAYHAVLQDSRPNGYVTLVTDSGARIVDASPIGLADVSPRQERGNGRLQRTAGRLLGALSVMTNCGSFCDMEHIVSSSCWQVGGECYCEPQNTCCAQCYGFCESFDCPGFYCVNCGCQFCEWVCDNPCF